MNTAPKNSSVGRDDSEWEQDGFRFIEKCRQEYAGNNCVFSAGLIEGHPIERAYLKWQKDGDEGTMLMLRADELAAIAWVATGAIWSGLYGRLEELDKQKEGSEEKEGEDE